jgi:hypothetical protein
MLMPLHPSFLFCPVFAQVLCSALRSGAFKSRFFVFESRNTNGNTLRHTVTRERKKRENTWWSGGEGGESEAGSGCAGAGCMQLYTLATYWVLPRMPTPTLAKRAIRALVTTIELIALCGGGSGAVVAEV